jgi:hypothetical protein
LGLSSGLYLTSLDSKHFSTLAFELDNRKRSRTFHDTIGDFRPRKLFAKLITYQIQNPEILNEEKLRAVMPEVSISTNRSRSSRFPVTLGSLPHPSPLLYPYKHRQHISFTVCSLRTGTQQITMYLFLFLTVYTLHRKLPLYCMLDHLPWQVDKLAMAIYYIIAFITCK